MTVSSHSRGTGMAARKTTSSPKSQAASCSLCDLGDSVSLLIKMYVKKKLFWMIFEFHDQSK